MSSHMTASIRDQYALSPEDYIRHVGDALVSHRSWGQNPVAHLEAAIRPLQRRLLISRFSIPTKGEIALHAALCDLLSEVQPARAASLMFGVALAAGNYKDRISAELYDSARKKAWGYTDACDIETRAEIAHQVLSRATKGVKYRSLFQEAQAVCAELFQRLRHESLELILQEKTPGPDADEYMDGIYYQMPRLLPGQLRELEQRAIAVRGCFVPKL